MKMDSVTVVVIQSLLAALCIPVIWSVVTAFRLAVWEPLKVLRFMWKAGYTGPKLSPFSWDNKDEIEQYRARAREAWKASFAKSGSVSLNHDFASLLFPEYMIWQKQYGDRFVYVPQRGQIRIWAGNKPDMVREVWGCKTGAFGRVHSSYADELLSRKAMGMVVDLDEWARQRRVVRTSFYEGAVKTTVSKIHDSALPWIQNLEKRVDESGGSLELDLKDELKYLSRDIVARAGFRMSYDTCKKGFENEEKLKILVTQSGGVLHPIFRYIIPNRTNREIVKTRNIICDTFKSVIEERRASVKNGSSLSYGDDLLGKILTAADFGAGRKSEKFEKWTDAEVIDQCRSLFFAGHDTVSATLAWMLILLGHYTKWQDRIRQEVNELFGENWLPQLDQLRELKSLDLFVLELLRLYPAFPHASREVHDDGVTLMGEPVPKGVGIDYDLIHLHRLPELWGEDALEFNPERFAKGIRGACPDTAAYNPFGYGPRGCVAQNHAVVELKVIACMFLQHFRFRLSSSYVHFPVAIFSLTPGFGAPLLLEKIK